MLILMMTTDDPAGTAVKFANAINRTTSHRCRVITTRENRHGHGWARDLHVPRMGEFGEIGDLLAAADVFHFHMTADENLPVGPYRPLQHRNGHNGGLTVVGHSPSRRDLKNTDEFEEVAAGVPGVRAQVIENVTNEECLRRKRLCDLFFDHMQGYYGVSSLEALSQDVPAIAGLDDWNVRCLRDFAGGDELPWIIARDRRELRRALERGRDDERGIRSRRFMEKHWTEERIAGRLVSFYESL